MIRVLIRAASPVVKVGLEGLLRSQDSFEIVDEISDEVSAHAGGVADQQADVIVAELENRDDEMAVEVFDEAGAGTPIVLLVRGPATGWTGAFRQGIRAVLPSNATGPQISAAIEAAAAGLVVIPASEIDGLVPSQRVNESPETLLEPLTPREIEVLRAMAEGLGNKEIASRLRISEHTVKFHVASVMGKLGATSRTEAAILGIRQGLVLI